MFTTPTVRKKAKLTAKLPRPTLKNIPQDVQKLADHIKALPCSRVKKNNGELSVIDACMSMNFLADCNPSL